MTDVCSAQRRVNVRPVTAATPPARSAGRTHPPPSQLAAPGRPGQRDPAGSASSRLVHRPARCPAGPSHRRARRLGRDLRRDRARDRCARRCPGSKGVVGQLLFEPVQAAPRPDAQRKRVSCVPPSVLSKWGTTAARRPVAWPNASSPWSQRGSFRPCRPSYAGTVKAPSVRAAADTEDDGPAFSAGC